MDILTNIVDDQRQLLQLIRTNVGAVREPKVDQQPLAVELFGGALLACAVGQIPPTTDSSLAQLPLALL